MTILDGVSAAFILDVERFPTASLPLATTPLSGNELMTLLQGGRNVYLTVSDFVAMFNDTVWIYKTVTYTAVSLDNIFVDTSGAPITINLPVTPAIGARVRFCDYAGTWGSNNLTVGRGGSQIMGLAQDMTVAVNRGAFTLVFSGGDWRLA